MINDTDLWSSIVLGFYFDAIGKPDEGSLRTGDMILVWAVKLLVVL